LPVLLENFLNSLHCLDITEILLKVALNTIKPTNLLNISFIFDRCKKWEVPLEKVYNKTQREKFRWAIDMADEDFVF
jgi:DNA topoisomerase-1